MLVCVSIINRWKDLDDTKMYIINIDESFLKDQMSISITSFKCKISIKIKQPIHDFKQKTLDTDRLKCRQTDGHKCL